MATERATYFAELAGVQPAWKTNVLCPQLRLRPRQFEYDPHTPGRLVFGTIRGTTVVCDYTTNEVMKQIESGISKDKLDPILGLCWFRKSKNRFISGSSCGMLTLCDLDNNPKEDSNNVASESSLSVNENSKNVSEDKIQTNDSSLSVSVSEAGTSSKLLLPPDKSIVRTYKSFEQLTSVHINSDDSLLLTCGYSQNVRVYDVATGDVVREFNDIHNDHINISRFTNHSPSVFATSSFDKTAKLWDMRCKQRPIYTLNSESGHVMLCFSPDDMHILTSAVDNEVIQYTALDGRKHFAYPIPKTNNNVNFTRAYYSCSGRFMLSGSSDEPCIRLHCSYTGVHLQSAELYPGRKHSSIYIQSLRGDPFHETRLSVLVNYRDEAYPLEIVNMDMLGDQTDDNSCHDGSLPGSTDSQIEVMSADKTLDSSYACPVDSDIQEMEQFKRLKIFDPVESSKTEAQEVDDMSNSVTEPCALRKEEGSGGEGAWFMVGRATSELMCRLREALLFSEHSDVILNYSSHQNSIRAHACILACRSRVFKKELLRKSERSTNQNIVNEAVDAIGANDIDESLAHISLDMPIRLSLLQVLLEYIYLDRLTLHCDRMANDNSQWLFDDVDVLQTPQSLTESLSNGENSGNTSTARAAGAALEGIDGANGVDQSEDESGVSDDGLMSDEETEVGDSSPKNGSAVGLHINVKECLHGPTILTEISNLVVLAYRLEMGHLISLCLARCKRIMSPSSVIAIAYLAKFVQEMSVPPLFHGGDDCDNGNIGAGLSGDSGGVADNEQFVLENNTDVAADLIEHCIQYLVVHLEHTKAALYTRLASEEMAAVLSVISDFQESYEVVFDDAYFKPSTDTPLDVMLKSVVAKKGWIRQAVCLLRRKCKLHVPSFNQDSSSGEGAEASRTEEEERILYEDYGDPDAETGLFLDYTIPPCFGHTCTAVLTNGLDDHKAESQKSRSGRGGGGFMVTIGGANRVQMIGLKDLLFFGFQDGIWRKVTTTGDAPKSLMYHTAVAVTSQHTTVSSDTLLGTNSPFQRFSQQHLVLFGGNTVRGCPKNLILVLDCVNLHWWTPHPVQGFKKPFIPIGYLNDNNLNDSNDGPCHRTRHSMLGFHPANISSSPPAAFEQSRAAAELRYDEPEDKLLSTLLLFGGYDAARNMTFNDIWLLDVFSSNRSSDATRSGSGSNSSSNPLGNKQDNLCFQWRHEDVAGEPPAARLAHAACMIQPSTWNSMTHDTLQAPSYMVVFGGLGLTAVYGDTHILKIDQPCGYHNKGGTGRGLSWKNDVKFAGSLPSPRYDHKMEVLQTKPKNKEAVIALFGGSTFQNMLGDLHIFTLDLSCDVLKGVWSTPKIASNNLSLPPPSFSFFDSLPSFITSRLPSQINQQSLDASSEDGNTISSSLSSMTDTSVSASAAGGGGASGSHSHNYMISSDDEEFEDNNDLTSTQDENPYRLINACPDARCSLSLCTDPNTGILLLFGGTFDMHNSEPKSKRLDNSIYLLHQPDHHNNYIGNESKSVTIVRSTKCETCNLSKEESDQVKLKPCSRCKVVSYCSRECQAKDWKENHRFTCRPYSEGGGDEYSWSALAGELYEPGNEVEMRWQPSSLISDLASLVNSDLFHDVTFFFDVVEEVEEVEQPTFDDTTCMNKGPNTSHYVYAHRVLLGRKNDPIRSMLTGNMIEARSGVVRMEPDIEKSTLVALVAFLYTDSLLIPRDSLCDENDSQQQREVNCNKLVATKKERNFSVMDPIIANPSPEFLMNLLYLAHSYTLTRLVTLCEGVLLRLVHAADNAVALLGFADMLNLPNLLTAIKSVCYRSDEDWQLFLDSEGYSDIDASVKEDMSKCRLMMKHLYMGQTPNHELKSLYELKPEDDDQEDV